MNEGKPTKAKWWSRPRPQGPADQAEGAPAAPGEYSVGTEGAPPVPGPTADGDYELRQPQQVAAGTADAEGDFALRSPRDAVREDGPSVPEPEPGPGPELGSEPGPEDRVSAGTQGDGDFELSMPLSHTAPAVEEDTADPSPKPLHDPDPYSTPPYGEPGPWAPAPPVQHPANTPSHGTAIPTPPQAHGTPARAPSAPSYADAPPPAPYAETPPTPHPANPWRNYDPWAPVPLPTSLQQNGAAVPTRDGRRKRARRVLLVGAVLLALVSGGVGGAVGAYLERNGGVGDVELPQADAEPAGRAPDSVAGIAARALPSVVTLHVSGAEEQGTGTGFVLDDRGHILTNNHVVEPAGAGGDISVTFHSGDTAKATVVGRDSGYDLAVVKVTGVSGLQPMTLGNSDSAQVGDPVVAIGAPYDLEGTVTSGIISAKERPITAGGESGDGSDVSYVDALQTDAPINPGNSGGPLLDSKARVIGINSAIRSADDGSDSGGAQSGSIGLGFAIPINQGKRVAEELINTGKATHPVIGVTLDMDYSGDGARVGTKGNDGGPAVIAGGAGDKAGIKSGDVITEVDGQRIHSGEELIVKTRAHRPGDRLELTVERGGEELAISLVLGSSEGD
ncbi:trypsin-like peptidase domain-containing protein [Streptomyces sp. NPDC047461]|uniref:S1C family serine protease n=1 Tax=Streptomyces sp. NPDC047461 TaxID=3155619 RepID=UPI0033EB21AA